MSFIPQGTHVSPHPNLKELKAVTDPEIKPLVALYLSAEYGHLSAAQTIMATMGKAAARR